MKFEKVYAHESVKHFLQKSIQENRISHAQLFVGKPGWGTFQSALTYAQAVMCGTNENCSHKIEKLTHPDLHFSIPTFNIEKRKALTKNYIQEFKSLVSADPFASLSDWYDKVEAGNKQGVLGNDEIMEVMNYLNLKSYEGGYKVLVIWYPEKMNTEYANKFLKLLEEPPEKTLFLLLAEKEENMLETITSRCIKVPFKPLSDSQIREYAEEHFQLVEPQLSHFVSICQGDIQALRNKVVENQYKDLFESEFIEWTRNSFRAKKDISVLQNIIEQAERIATWNTEQQKQYIQFCIETFRSALLQNYRVKKISTSAIEKNNFNFEGFSNFISGANIQEIIQELNSAYYHVERNANKKLLFTNLGIKLTRFIHKTSYA